MDAETAVLKLQGAARKFGVDLEIALPSGSVVRLGNDQPSVRLVFRSAPALKALLTLNEDRLADAFVYGEVDAEGPFSDLLRLRQAMRPNHGFRWLARFLVPLLRGQRSINAEAIRQHYELDPDFYLSFLDRRWPAYSQGIYSTPSDTLSEAVERKFAFATTACDIGPDSHVLEVGPGWGAYLRYIQPTGARLTALTNSAGMKNYLDKLVDGRNIRIVCDDFLAFQPQRRFSALTMMGVLEHLPQYDRVCRQIRALVEPGRRAYLDASAALKKYSMSAFVYKHIFPYNHSFLHLDSFLKAAKKEGLKVVEMHDDSDHYRRTFTDWASNFERCRDDLARRYNSYDVRRFRLYLWGSVHAFEEGGLQCHRLVLETPN
jgi:cyclopropane-fatty-acyl-phospholipid synthase